VTLLGPSGCGKTTTLRIIGGFEQPDSGDVLFEGRRLNDVPPYRREINTVFQRYALFPHLNVAENIAFGLHIKKMNPSEIKLKTREMLSLVGLSGFEARDVTSLSGGQQQRVAIARALVCEPRVLLLDKNAYEAALDLGATPRQTLHKVILPEIMPGIVTGGIMAFTMSVDDFVVSYFTAGTTSQPLSVVIYSMTRHRMTPKINAVSTLLFCSSLCCSSSSMCASRATKSAARPHEGRLHHETAQSNARSDALRRHGARAAVRLRQRRLRECPERL